jgi:hypothetical protein
MCNSLLGGYAQLASGSRIRAAHDAVLSARVQLDPAGTNRARLQTFLALSTARSPTEPDGVS